MPAVDNLDGTRCAQPHTAPELGRAVAGDYLGLATARMQPSGQRVGAAVGQQIHDSPRVQVNEDGAVGVPALERPIIHAHCGWGRSGGERQGTH